MSATVIHKQGNELATYNLVRLCTSYLYAHYNFASNITDWIACPSQSLDIVDLALRNAHIDAIPVRLVIDTKGAVCANNVANKESSTSAEDAANIGDTTDTEEKGIDVEVYRNLDDRSIECKICVTTRSAKSCMYAAHIAAEEISIAFEDMY